MLLGLEEVEQVAASSEAETEAANAGRAGKPLRQAPHEPGIAAGASAAHRDGGRYRGPCLPVLRQRAASDRRGSGERLDIVPAQFRVLVVRRPKYACRACEDVVVQAPAPARLIEGGLPTEATVAQVLVSKYADHLPLYRQAQIYARQGINLDRSTLADWVGRAAFMLRPVHERLLATLKGSAKLFADETTAPVLDPGRGRTKTGQLWAYARDDRPWGGSDPPGVAYVYAPDRKAERPIAHLAGFNGILQVDGYGGYRVLAERGDVQLAFCWAHVRRRFYELAAAGPAPIASEALERIAGLYAIETDIRGRSAEERRAVRQDKSRPIVDDLEPWLRAKLALISQKTKLAEAIRYALSRWDGLTRFLDDGRIEIDSNVVERTIRPDRAEPQECALRRLRRRRRALGRHRLADRDLQAQRRRTARLSRRRHHQDRQRPPQQPHRRAPALGLSRRARAQARGLKTSLTLLKLSEVIMRERPAPQARIAAKSGFTPTIFTRAAAWR